MPKWESAGTDEPGDQNGDSAIVKAGCTSMYWTLGPTSEDMWELELIGVGDEGVSLLFGTFDTEAAAKKAAERYERFAIAVPADYPVKVLEPGDSAAERMTCGDCGRSWDDAIVTGMTPVPSARCPFELFHEAEEEEVDGDDKINRAAKFYPALADDEGTLPCIEVAGVQVYVYVENGTLVISADFDSSELGETTPVRVTMSGETVWQAQS